MIAKSVTSLDFRMNDELSKDIEQHSRTNHRSIRSGDPKRSAAVTAVTDLSCSNIGTRGLGTSTTQRAIHLTLCCEVNSIMHLYGDMVKLECWTEWAWSWKLVALIREWRAGILKKCSWAWRRCGVPKPSSSSFYQIHPSRNVESSELELSRLGNLSGQRKRRSKNNEEEYRNESE